MGRRAVQSELKEIASHYGGAMDHYERTMLRGKSANADDAIDDMHAIEKSVVIIERARK